MLKQRDTPNKALSLVNSKNSSLGIVKIDTKSARQAINGQTGFEIIDGSQGMRVASAYSAFEVGETRWAVLSEIEEEEAFAALTSLTRSLSVTSIISTLILVGIGILVALWLGNYLSAPLIAVSYTHLTLPTICSV